MSGNDLHSRDDITPYSKLDSLDDIMAAAQAGRVLIQNFVPLAESLDWELGQLYWKRRGSQAFINSEVPYVINNDGALSRQAAEIFFTGLQAAEANGRLEERIFALELGVGIGLFARYFLDAFRELCLRHGRNYYQRFCYIAADSSERMLSHLEAHRVLEDHEGHYRLALVDAMNPRLDWQEGRTDSLSGAVRAVFLNYVLDSLPATVLKLDGEEISQLCLRTYLARGVDIRDHTALSAEDLVRCAVSSDPEEKQQLIDLYHLFSLDFDYRPVALGTLPYAELAVSSLHVENGYLIHNYGVLQCLEGLLGYLRDGGMILINDYGLAKETQTSVDYQHQRFAGSAAIGVNFPLLKAYFAGSERLDWVEPKEDNGHIYTRLLGRRIAPEVIDRFHERFGKESFDWLAQPIELARAHIQEGRYEAGLEAYREALRRQPRNWVLLGEIARFLTLTIQDYAAGLELSRAALALNPISPDIRNTLGDSLFYLGRVDEAHQSFLHALELNPRDVRACYNLIYTFARSGDFAYALRMVAEGLLYDEGGEYRERLLAKQAEILDRLTQRRQQRLRLLANRSNTLMRRVNCSTECRKREAIEEGL
jgi:tetratricopeptide (TPR) repeat protein